MYFAYKNVNCEGNSVMSKINCDNESIVYFSRYPEKTSHNGLYIIRAGETMPNPYYYHERPENFLSDKGGLYVFEYVISGRGYIECEGKTYTVSAGDFYVLTRFHSHKYYSDPQDPFRKIWVNLRGPYINSLADTLGLDEGVYVLHYDSPQPITQIHSLLESFTNTPRHRVFDNIALIVTEIMLSVNYSQNDRASIDSPVIIEIKRYIDSEVNIAATVDDICLQFSINKSYAIAAFKKAFGITLYQYMLDKKIKTAKAMLENGVKINNIAQLLGYSCTQSFTHAFKGAAGVTPNVYRENVSRNSGSATDF